MTKQLKHLEVHLGKKGITHEFIKDIERRLDKYTNADIKINVLKNARESKQDVINYAEEIVKELGPKYTYKVLGFSIFLKKWRKIRENPKE